MTDTIISVRIDKNIKEKMNMQEHINWSAILRRAILQHLENENKIDLERAKKASKEIDKIRNSGIFNGGKTGTEIIREWRNKRK